MMNPTDLDVRFLNHAARVRSADLVGHLYPTLQPEHNRLRQIVATLLLRLSIRLAPEQTRRMISRDSAVA